MSSVRHPSLVNRCSRSRQAKISKSKVWRVISKKGNTGTCVATVQLRLIHGDRASKIDIMMSYRHVFSSSPLIDLFEIKFDFFFWKFFEKNTKSILSFFWSFFEKALKKTQDWLRIFFRKIFKKKFENPSVRVCECPSCKWNFSRCIDDPDDWRAEMDSSRGRVSRWYIRKVGDRDGVEWLIPW